MLEEFTLPDHPKLMSKAVSAGFETVEAYVRHLIEADAGPLDTQPLLRNDLSQREWKRKFQELLTLVEPGNPQVDDSRESIYPVR